MGRSCSTAVDLEIMGLNPADCWDFSLHIFISIVLYLSRVSLNRTLEEVQHYLFSMKRYLGVLLWANQLNKQKIAKRNNKYDSTMNVLESINFLLNAHLSLIRLKQHGLASIFLNRKINSVAPP